MFSFRNVALTIGLLPFSVVLAQTPGSTTSAPFHVHHKHVSSAQGVEYHFGSTVAMHGEVLVAADDNETVEVVRRNGDGSWAFEALIAPPVAGIDFGSANALATNGDWLAIGAGGDDTFGTNAGAVHLYKFDGLDWQYEGALSHMAPFGNIGYDGFGKAVAMDGNRMVVGSNAENPDGGKGAIHYFEYNTWLDMWLETGFIPSSGTANGNTTRFAAALDVSGDWMIVGEYGDNTTGNLAGAAYLYKWFNQCWHLDQTFYGHEAGDRLGTDVGISGDRAVAGSPQAGLDGLNQSGAVTLYELEAGEWIETHHFIPSAVQSWDRFGSAVDIDGDLLAVGAPTDDNNGQNAGLGYFLFDCSSAELECVAEGSACDAEPNDRFGHDVAVSNGLAAIGAERDDNIFEEAGSVYVLGADDLGFECDLTAPAPPTVDLVDESDSGADDGDNITRHTTPDFDVFLPGGGTAALMNGVMAQAGDALVWTLQGSGETEMVILTDDDIDNGYVNLQFIYPGPVLPDGVYTFCAYLIDAFGNVGDEGCLTITIDNDDPELVFENGAEYDTSNTDGFGVFLPGASSPEECEELAGLSGGVWDGTYTDAEANMIASGCYIVNGGTNPSNVYQWHAYTTLLADTTLYLDAMGSATFDVSTATNISATDNIGLDTLFAEPTSFGCGDAGSLVPVTLTAIDIAGNIGSITIQVEVLDTLPPAAAAQDLTVQLGADGTVAISAADVDNGSSDNCSIAASTLDITAFDCDDVGANTVTLTVTDPSGNVSTATATITVQDNAAPTALAQDLTAQLDANGMVSITAAQVDNGSGDNCGDVSITLDQTDFDCSHVGTNTVTLTVTDQNGNTTTDTAVITVEDNIAPTALAQDLTIQLDANGQASITTAQVDNGSSDNCGIDGSTIDVSAFDCGDLGANTVTLTVTDVNGNTSTATATVTVEDNAAPNALAQDLTIQLDANGQASITAAQVDNGSSDNCTISGTSLDETDFDCGDLGTNVVTLTVTDDAGNSSTATASITVQDNIAPTALAQDLTVQLDATGMASITAAQVDNGSTDNCSITSITVNPSDFDCGDLGANSVTLTVTDQSGNTSTASATVTVEDNLLPGISGTPSAISLSNDAGLCGAAATWTAPTASDNCSATLTASHSSGDTFPVGTTTVTFTAVDPSGNQSTTSFTVTVSDDEDPAIVGVPSDITQTNDAGNCSAAVTWSAPSVSDNCGIATSTSSHDSGDTFPVGTTTVSYMASDINGNTTTSTFTVTVTDDEAPAISGMPANISQNADAGACTTDVTWTAPTASDNCGVTSFTSDYNSGDTFSFGTTTVTYTATDAAGNTTTSTFTVTINEVEAPTISGMPADISQTADAGQCSAAVTWTEPTASDNCNVASFTSTHSPGAAFAVGTTTVTYTATDDAGNTTTASFTVTVTDDEAPSLSGTPVNITQTNDAGNCSAVVSWTDPTGSDNCAIATLTSSHNSGDSFPVGSTTVNFTAADIHGNTTTGTFTVTVTDDENPAISGMPSDIALNNDAGNCSAVASWTEPTASDNCAVATFTSSHDSGDAFPVGSTTVSYTATDINGNATTSTFTVTVTDNEAPTISGMPTNITQTNDAGDCSAAVSWTAPTAADNCAIATFSSDIASGSTFNVGTTTVTYTATDIHGNQTTASFTVTVTDDESPSISGTPTNITQSNDAGNCSAAVSWTAPTAADNCGVSTFTSTHSPGDTFPVGTTTVTYTATDAAGNSSSTSFNVVVSDDENPAISGMPADIALTNDAGNCSAVASWTAPTATDNCAVGAITSSHDSGDAFPVGSTTVSYTATDIHGNSTTSTFTVTVTDNEAPTISGMPTNITQANDAGDCSAAVSWTAPTAADNCAIASLSADIASGSTFSVGTTTVTYTATDIYGLQTTASFTVTVTDDESPSITGTPADITQSNEAGECEAEVTWTAPTAADNCGVTSWSSSHDTGDTFAVGTTTVTYTAMDAAGNTSSSSFTVTVTDDEDPVITMSASDSTYQRDGNEDMAFSNWLAANGGATATDNCALSGWTNDSEGLSDGCGSTGSETVTFTANDIHGNSSTTSATFTVIDDFAPSCPLIDLTDESDLGLSNTDNLTSDDTPTMRVVFTGSGVESAEAGDVVEWYVNTVLTENYTVTQTDVDNGYAEFETGAFADGPVLFSARHIDGCGQASIFAFLNIIVHSTAPTAVADGLTLLLDADGNVSIDAGDLDDGSSDDFNVVAFSADQTEFDCADLGDNTVTLTVTDIAGNTATATATVTVIDDLAPVIAPMDITVELDATGAASIAVSDVATISDNCTVSASSIDITTFDCTDVGTVTVTISATDQSGNSSTATATVTVEDNHAPEVVVISGGGGGITVELGADGTVTIAPDDVIDTATDNCGISGMSLDNDTFDCSMLGDNTVTLTVTDVNGNATSAQANVHVVDNEAPVVHIFDLEDYTLYAGETCVNEVDLFAAGQPWYEATDNCEIDVNIIYDVVNETGIAGCREFDRRWIIQAVDASGNMGSDTTLQHITVLDATAPLVFFDNTPEDLTLELGTDCTVDIPEAGTSADSMLVTATDNCTAMPTLSGITYTDGAPEYLCEGGGSYTIARTFTATATDDCGNETVAEYVQTITILDITAPQITDSEGIMNGETLTETEAGGIFDFISLPEAIELEAEDGCSDVTIALVETESGFVPTEDIGNYCGASTPAAFSGGESCSGAAPAAIVLEGAPFNGEAFTIMPGGINIVESYFDQTLHIEIEVTNADGTGGFIWNADYNEAFNWNEWSALGRGYKKDCANVLPGQTPWTQWQYFVMQTGGMIGTGIYAGSELSLTHQPMNYHYGLQVGNGANNQNANYGASAWFYWSGELVLNGASQGSVGSSGDIMLDLDCVMPWAMDFSYTVTDACGNETLFSYGVTNAAAQPDDAAVSGEGSGHQPFDISVSGDVKEPIRVTGLQPNPTNNVSQLGFVVSNNMRLRVDLYDMSGQLIQELFDGNAMSDVQYLMTIDAQGLDAGMYQIRIASNTYLAVKKLLVTQ